MVTQPRNQKPTKKPTQPTRQALGNGLGAACRAAGALLVVDSVAALGGVPFLADEWGVDAGYSGSQKCLSAPPGACLVGRLIG
jgi:hypothetical protein